jgi:RND family efflux transporter MFP subunit
MKPASFCRRVTFLTPLLVVMPLACGQQPEAEKTPPAPVQAVNATAYSFGQWTDLSGTTLPLPQHAARISAAVEGKVQSILTGADGKPIHEGQLVNAGDVVVQFDDRVARANRDKLAASQKDLEEQTKQAGYTVQLAQKELTRLQGLLSRGTASPSDTFPLVSPVDVEKADLALKTAESQKLASAARQEASAKELKALEEQLALYALRAPIAGRLGMVQVVPGQALTVGTAVADVIDLDQIDVLCYVPPHLAGLIALGQRARLVVAKGEGKGGVPPLGQVAFVADMAQPESGNLPAKVRFANSKLGLRANAVARVQVETEPEKPRLAIPDSALMDDQEPPAVIVVEQLKEQTNDEGKTVQVGKARRLQATIGVRNREWQKVEILALKDPDKKEKVSVQDALFVTKGGQGLRDGDDVVIQQEEEGD